MAGAENVVVFGRYGVYRFAAVGLAVAGRVVGVAAAGRLVGRSVAVVG